MEAVLSDLFYIQLVIWIVCCVICTIAFFIQTVVIRNRFKSVKQIQRTYISSVLAHCGYVLFFITAIFQHTYNGSCICDISNKIVSGFYNLGKWNMYWFFICRAEVVQGIMPLLPEPVFRVYGPIFLISTFMFTYIMQMLFMEFECADASAKIDTYCYWTYSPIWLGMLGISLELSNVIIFTGLFAFPLYRIHKTNETGDPTRKVHLIKQLKWNIIFTLIATLSSLLFLSTIIFTAALPYWWLFVAIDNTSNSLACFFMMKPNVQWVTTKCGICDVEKKLKAAIDSTNVNKDKSGLASVQSDTNTASSVKSVK
eukprot:230304_1